MFGVGSVIFPFRGGAFSASRPLPVYAPWSRVWGFSPLLLSVVVVDPVGSGVLRQVEGGSVPSVLVIRPALGKDHVRIDDVRVRDRVWLAPWEATSPPQAVEVPPSLRGYQRACDRGARRGESLVMVAELDGLVCGVVSVNSVVRGAMYGASVGYWVSSSVAGRGLGSFMVGWVMDLLIGELGLHRLEVNVRPQNQASLALVRKLGLRQEGFRPRFLHINGQWADHVQFAVDSEDFVRDGSLCCRLGLDHLI